MKKTLRAVFLSFVLFATLSPVAAFAQGAGTEEPSELKVKLQEVLNFVDDVVVPMIFGLAFVVFLWFIFVYFIAGAADEEKRAKGKQFLLWSIIGFVLMLSLWGIVNLLVSSLGFADDKRACLPGFSRDETNCD